MATEVFPPILDYTPEGGVPGSPVSNPPVYSQADVMPLVEGQAYVDVVFGSTQTTDDWVLVACEVYNTTDFEPLNIWPGIITDRSTAGFRIQLNGMPDSGNYYLSWAVSGINITPVPATTYAFTGPTTGTFGSSDTFTVRFLPSTTGSVTVTPSDGGDGGVFAPTSVTLTSASPIHTFTYAPASFGAKTLSVTNSGVLTDPADIVYTVAAVEYALAGPSGGDVGVASTNFHVFIALESSIPGTVTVTPSDGGAGGTFTPTTVDISDSLRDAYFTYTPASVGAKTISVTNDGGLVNPANLTYTAVSAVHLLTTLISYWKMDEASGANKNDSQGTNHLSDPTSCGSFAAKINNAAYFSSLNYLTVANNATLQVTSDFTWSFWVRVDAVGAGAAIISKFTGAVFDYLFSHDPAAGLSFIVGSGGSVNVGSPAAAFTWYHVVGWYDSADSKLRIRINDTTTYTATTTTTLIQNTSALVCGALTSGMGAPFTGLIDEVGFWKRKLTSAEITALYNGSAALPYSSFTA